MRADIGKLRRALGSPKPPKTVTQEPYVGNLRHLRRLACGDWREQLPSSSDLFCYVEDINWCDVVQPDFFRYMLPVLLEMWRQDLMRESFENAQTVEWLYNGMARRRLVNRLLGDKAEKAASAFMRDAILDRIDDADAFACEVPSASPYDWIHALASFGILFPQVDSLWSEWWSIDTKGQARAVLQYSSVLLYERENPLFPHWSPERGGGPPTLWELAGLVHEKNWLPENVAFLRDVLTPHHVEDGIHRAVDKLRGSEPDELLDRLIADLPGQRPVLDRRVAALPDIFAQQVHHYLDWADAAL